MAKKTDSDDMPAKFWIKWLESDELQRIKMLQTTMLVKDLSAYMLIKFKGSKLRKGFAPDFAARMFNDYLQDLEMTMVTKR